MIPDRTYKAQWFNPRTGEWSDTGSGTLTADASGTIQLPLFPNGLNMTTDNEDWAMKLLAD